VTANGLQMIGIRAPREAPLPVPGTRSRGRPCIVTVPVNVNARR